MKHARATKTAEIISHIASFATQFRPRRLAPLALCALIAAAPLGAQNVLKDGWDAVADEIRALAAAKMQAANTTGMSIVLVDGDEIAWSEGFGFSDAAAGKKADADTMMEIGSVSKTFSGLMVMQLAERGRIDIDRPAADYIPGLKIGPPARDFPRNDRPITVRDLMNHHSGLPGDLLHGAFSMEPDPDFNRRLLAWLAKDRAVYPPGYRWAYSNTAVALLENVIESGSGTPFAEYSDAFLASMGMAPASYYKRDPALRSRLSKAYNEGKEFPTIQINIPASGSIVASANQMGRYLRMLIGEGAVDGARIVRPETLRAMRTPQNLDIPLDKGFEMGLSFILTDAELAWAGPLYWHNGATLAFHSHMEILPGHKLGVIAIANSIGSDPVVQDVAKAALVSALKWKRGVEKPAPAAATAAAPAPLARVDLPERTLAGFAGLYVNDDRGNYHRFATSGAGLAWKTGPADENGALKDQGTLHLYSDGFFRTAPDAPLGLEFREAGGRTVLTVHLGGSSALFGERFAPKPIPPAWRARLGAWSGFDLAPHDAITATEGPPALTLRESDGLLLLVNDETTFVVEPISDTLGAVVGLGRFGGNALRIARGADGRETLEFMLVRYAKDAPEALTPAQVAAVGAEANALAKAIIANGPATALSIAVADERGIVWQGHYGSVDAAGGPPPTRDTMFGLCSVSKNFVAASVMKLADRGLVKLDAPVTRYIPEFTMEDPRYRDITVRMLLNHSAGLPGISIQGAVTMDKPFTGYADRVLRSQALQRLKYEPGLTSMYANDGFSILEVLVRNVSGLSYPEFVRREIFAPLSLRGAAYQDQGSGDLAPGSFAMPGFFADSGLPYHNMYGSGALFMSAADLALFGGSYLRPGSLLSAESIAAMAEDRGAGRFGPVHAKDMNFGLGWDTVTQPGMAAVGVKGWQKGGDLGYYGSTLLVLPEEKLAIAVVGATGFGSSAANAIAEKMALRALLERGRTAAMPAPAPLHAEKAQAPDYEERTAISGYYAQQPMKLLRAVFDDQGILGIEARTDDGWKPFIPGLEKRADGWYSNDDIPVSIRYAAEGGHAYLALAMPGGAGHYRNELLFAEKVPAGLPMPDAWKQRLDAPWLLASELAEAEDPNAAASPRMIPRESPELPGYIEAQAIDELHLLKAVDSSRAAMWMLMPEVLGRDLRDLRTETLGGADYLRFGSERYRRADSVPALPAGNSLLASDAPGLGAWRKLPPEGFVSVSRTLRWRLFDPEFELIASGTGEGSARWSAAAGAGTPAGAWLVVYPDSAEGASVVLSD